MFMMGGICDAWSNTTINKFQVYDFATDTISIMKNSSGFEARKPPKGATKRNKKFFFKAFQHGTFGRS